MYKAIAMTYYMFTTMSTVGLGDYHPENSAERLIMVIIMLVGVSITSYNIQNMVEMGEKIHDLNQDLDQM